MTQRMLIDEADTSRLRQTYPEVFASPLKKRLASLLLVVALTRLLIFGMVWLGLLGREAVERDRQAGCNPRSDVPTESWQPPPSLSAWSRQNTIDRLRWHASGRAARLSDGACGRKEHRSSEVDPLLFPPFSRCHSRYRYPDLGPHFHQRGGARAVCGHSRHRDVGFRLIRQAVLRSHRNGGQKAREGVRSTGGSSLHEVVFGVLPQVLPVILSQVLYYFESNTRSATVIGIVGAGGIGLYLSNEIGQQNWDHVSFLILMVLVTVAVIDQISSRLRFAIIGAIGI